MNINKDLTIQLIKNGNQEPKFISKQLVLIKEFIRSGAAINEELRISLILRLLKNELYDEYLISTAEKLYSFIMNHAQEITDVTSANLLYEYRRDMVFCLLEKNETNSKYIIDFISDLQSQCFFHLK
ncbi:MAG: hypothetical protein RSD40_06385 [Bacilli bacterium]